MKKDKNKVYHDADSKRKFKHALKRKDKKYIPVLGTLDENHLMHFEQNQNSNHKRKTIGAPIHFSLVTDTDDTLLFFNKFFDAIDSGVSFITIDMSHVQDMTIEVLLYLISLQRINKENNLKINITVKAPRKKELRYLISQSGFGKYFKGNVDATLNESDIFSIMDGESNRLAGIDDADTCKDAIDYALKYFKSKTKKDFRLMYNAMAEMMTNTDNHAYDVEIFRNWYLFAVKVERGVSFFFFDNGHGIIKTAKKNMLEKAVDYTFSLGHKSLMESVLNGEYRSATGHAYRNKGLPEINQFLTQGYVAYPVILTNKVFCRPDSNVYEKNKYNFRGSLFAWILKEEDLNV